ncbi:MAG: SAM-dependent methyltransferase [Myxococcota bacterium]
MHPADGEGLAPTARYDRKDAFYRRAKDEGRRSRAAFKLEDLLRRAPSLARNAAVLDLGCWPGGWLEVLAQRIGPEGRIVGVDLQPTDPVAAAQVRILTLDMCAPESLEPIRAALGRPADAVLCDASPKLTGVRDVDLAAIDEIYAAALSIARALLRPRGFLIVKGFPGQESDLFRKELKRHFADVHEIRPEGKRTTSKEFYWVACQRRG